MSDVLWANDLRRDMVCDWPVQNDLYCVCGGAMGIGVLVESKRRLKWLQARPEQNIVSENPKYSKKYSLFLYEFLL
jgi:hypothetical protein